MKTANNGAYSKLPSDGHKCNRKVLQLEVSYGNFHEQERSYGICGHGSIVILSKPLTINTYAADKTTPLCRAQDQIKADLNTVEVYVCIGANTI